MSQQVLCKSCKSANHNGFVGEVAIHFDGLAGVNKPLVWVFPRLLVCLDCGFTEFSIPKRELRVLGGGVPAGGGEVISWRRLADGKKPRPA